jgi:hypothetical protein
MYYFTVTRRRHNLVPGLNVRIVDALHDPVRQGVAHLPRWGRGPDDRQIVERVFTDVGERPQRHLVAEEGFQRRPRRSDARRGSGQTRRPWRSHRYSK